MSINPTGQNTTIPNWFVQGQPQDNFINNSGKSEQSTPISPSEKNGNAIVNNPNSTLTNSTQIININNNNHWPHQNSKINISLISHLPSALKQFTGRAPVLEWLNKGCDFENKMFKEETPTLHLHGLAGLGKSETALVFANRNKERFSLIWHMNCESSALYFEAYRRLAEALNVDYQKPPEELVRDVHFRLENLQIQSRGF